MSNEINLPHSETGASLYAIVRDSQAQAANTSTEAFQAYATAQLGNYAIELTELGTASKYYAADMPAFVSAGDYTFTVHEGDHESPAETDEIIASGEIHWDGAAVIPLSQLKAIYDKLPSKAYLAATANADGDVQLNEATGGLAADALNNISIAAPTGVASNFREMIVALWRMFFKKATMTDSEIKTFADNGTTVLTTQTVSDESGTQTRGAAS